jgi:hypothetical protein
MAKIPRLNAGDVSAPTPAGALPTTGAPQIFGSMGDALAGVGDVAAAAEKAEAAKRQAALEAKQAIVNEVEAGRRAGDFEESLFERMEALKVEFADAPDKAPAKLLELAREDAKLRMEDVSNSAVGLQFAQRSNSRIDSAMREMHNWALTRQTQKTKGELEGQKNQLAFKAARAGTPEQLDAFAAAQKADLFPKFKKVYGAAADQEWTEAETRMAESWVRIRGDSDPIGVRNTLTNPGLNTEGLLVKRLTPEKRDALLQRTERAIEHRGEVEQYERLKGAADDTVKYVGLLNAGKLDAATLIAAQHKNVKAVEAARLDTSYTPEQRAARVAFLEKQGKVLEAVDDIRMRGIKYDPVKAAVNDVARMKTINAELKRYKSKSEQLPIIVEQMQLLTLARKSGELSPTGYATAFDVLGLAFNKAVVDESDNDGLGPAWLPWNDAQEAGNDQMNKIVETRLQNVEKEKINEAWADYMARFVAASKNGDVSKEDAARMARNAISAKTSVNVRVKGD